MDELRAADRNTPRYQVHGNFLGKVVVVTAGDTCRVAVRLPCPSTGKREVRALEVVLIGYEAPPPESTEYALEVRNVLQALILNRVILLSIPETQHPDPGGRTRARIYALVNAPRPRPWLARVCGCRTGCRTASQPPPPHELPVRSRDVSVPQICDIAEKNRRELLDVSEWMICKAGVAIYTVGRARHAWTRYELIHGHWLDEVAGTRGC
jgi:hypothetical protein